MEENVMGMVDMAVEVAEEADRQEMMMTDVMRDMEVRGMILPTTIHEDEAAQDLLRREKVITIIMTT